MIITEFYKVRGDGVFLYRTYSDEGYYIIQEQTGNEYSEAIDVEGCLFTYIESLKKIEEVEIYEENQY